VSTLSVPGDRPEWVRHAATRIAHRHPILLVIVGAIAVVQSLTHTNTGWLAIVIDSAAMLLLVVGYGAAIWHERTLCEICAELTPLDASAAAQRQRPVLWFFHRGDWFGLGVLAGGALSDWLLHTDIMFYSMFAFFALTSLVAQRHRLLEPWCPWCHWDDGGAEEQVPTPPVPSVTADK
jgi:hypothetical protein